MLTKKGKITIIQEEEEEVQHSNIKHKAIVKEEKKLKKKRNEQDHLISIVQKESSKIEKKLIHEEVKSKKNVNKIAHLAICFPDSILQVPQTSALRAYFISEVARIASIFKVDEIVVLKDQGYTQKSEKFIPCDYIARNLQYLETPQYLRKYLFKMHPDLNNVGLMNPVESSHHLRSDQKSEFREGVALERPTKTGAGSWVDIGLKQQARMDVLVLPLTRVTLRIKNFEDQDANIFEAEAISKSIPRQERGMYWGYDVRIAHNLKQMTRGYDTIILCNHSQQNYDLPEITNVQNLELREKNVLIYFSGTDNLDQLIKRDPQPKWTFQQAIERFDYAIKFAQTGVKQLRLEERMILTLSRFSEFIL